MSAAHKHFNVDIPHKNNRDIVLELLSSLRPNWSIDNIVFKHFSEGISNTLFGCRLHDGEETDVVMFRLYGNQTELFIDRKQELEMLETLHRKSHAPPLYCTFNNGYAYGYFPGRTLDTEELSRQDISTLIAKKLAHVHCIELPPGIKEPCVFTTIEKFMRVRPERFEDESKQQRYEAEISSKIDVGKEVDLLKPIFAELNVPLALCHNDLLVKNLILNNEQDDISFIDYEYGGVNYCLYDIGNHFNEFGGIVVVPDYSLYPSKEFQLKWLRVYVEEKAKIQGNREPITDEYLEKLYTLVNKFSLVSHLFWGTWALLQANFSTIDFDYLEYGKQRFHEYLRRKEEFLSSK